MKISKEILDKMDIRAEKVDKEVTCSECGKVYKYKATKNYEILEFPHLCKDVTVRGKYTD